MHICTLLQWVFDIACKWTPPKQPEHQSITLWIILDLIHRVPSSQISEFSLAVTVCDAAFLGTFTESCISEYAQSQVPKESRFQSISVKAASGSKGSKNIDFILRYYPFF